VDSLIVNGSLSLDLTEIREHIVQFYTHLYSEQYSCRPKLDGLSFHFIGDEEGSWLEREFEESEVFEVVKTLNGDKASGSDGFSSEFFPDLLGGP
jgi:hypothetical protein